MNKEQTKKEGVLIRGYQPDNSNDEQPKSPTTCSDTYTLKSNEVIEALERESRIRNKISLVNDTIKYTPIEKKNKRTGTVTTTEYAEVKERIAAFRNVFPEGSISTKIIELDNTHVIMSAEVFNENGSLLAKAHASETIGGSFINETAMLENCETSAVGRALGLLGIGIKGAVASAMEIKRAEAIRETRDNMKVCHCCGRPINDAVDKSGKTWHADEISKITVSTYGDAYCLPCLMEFKNKKSKLEG